jgi:hypothetical protein
MARPPVYIEIFLSLCSNLHTALTGKAAGHRHRQVGFYSTTAAGEARSIGDVVASRLTSFTLRTHPAWTVSLMPSGFSVMLGSLSFCFFRDAVSLSSGFSSVSARALAADCMTVTQHFVHSAPYCTHICTGQAVGRNCAERAGALMARRSPGGPRRAEPKHRSCHRFFSQGAGRGAHACSRYARPREVELGELKEKPERTVSYVPATTIKRSPCLQA